ncbi:MAG: Eco57I restriction-modification methylase domain-containing protein [Candidatus Nitrosocaldaceae archaeon]
MNPPYIRHEYIPKDKKQEYADLYNEYNLSTRSDLYCYFMIRVLDLIDDNGVICVITSDKWLETGYGITLQSILKKYIIAIYGKKIRSFDLDINAIIVLYSKKDISDNIMFILFDDYMKLSILNIYVINKLKLQSGKWFYLHLPLI